MPDDNQEPIEYLGVTIRPCLREQSTEAGDRWYLAIPDETGIEPAEDECLRYPTPEEAMAGVDLLLKIHRERSAYSSSLEGVPE